jgi:hypothetical protein
MSRLMPALLLAGIIGIGFILWTLVYDPSPRYEVPRGAQIFDVVEGTWAWTTTEDGCSEEPQGITFSSGRDQMFLTRLVDEPDSTGSRESRSTYDVLDHSRSHIRGRIVGETRLTEEGEPVVWDLVVLSEDAFAWHRADWSDYVLTESLQRCPDPGT